MVILDLFSKREKKRLKQGQEDVFQYDNLPKEFRVQVIHIWVDAIGPWRRQEAFMSRHAQNDWWEIIFGAMIRELGTFSLGDRDNDPFSQCQSYLLSAETPGALDLIELTFRFIDNSLRKLNDHERRQYGLCGPGIAITELNGRFREHGIGYEYADGEIVRVDSKYIHAEAVRPALQLLHDAGKQFAGPLQEFLGAHERYRMGEHKDAISWALKAFESTMKAICTARSWPFDPHKDTAKLLLDIVYANKLVPEYLQNHLGGLRSVLDGVATLRNKTAGHGQGAAPVDVPEHLVAYVMHMTASNIVFLIQSHKVMK